MFTINLLGNIEPLSIYVARPNGEILGCLDNEIVADTANIELALNDYYQLSFDIKRDPTQALSWYDYLQDGMYVLVEKIGLFKINEPSRTLTGDTDSKSITATSCNIELDDKNLYISINMGTKTSLEYLVSDGEHDNGELHFTYNNSDDFELLIDPYRGIPIDWIVIQNKFKEQLDIFLDEYRNGYYGTLNANGSVAVTNTDKVKKFKDMVDLIPRLQTRFDRNYQAVANPSGNPKELGYYVFSNHEYVLTNDTSVVSGTTYYSWNGEYTPISLVEFTYTNEVVTQINTTPGYSTQIQRLISFYETYAPQLSLLDLVLEETGGDWTVGSIYGVDIGDYTIANRKAQFELDGEAIYSFLSSSLAKYLECIVQYDIFARTVNISPIQYFKPITLPSGSPKDYGVYEYVNFKYVKSTDESINNSKTYYQLVYEIGQDTGIVMSYDNLVNSLGVSSNEDKLTTRLFVTGGNDMNIRRVNFGMDYIVDLSYKMNATDEHNHRIFVSDSFAGKYNRYLAYREQQRESYIAYSLEYEKLLKEINELKYRVPNDDLKNDWSTFSMEDLQTYRTAYLNSLNTLITLYKKDYGSQPNALKPDTSVNEDYIKNTEYWYDYQAYKSLIDEVECAIATFPYYSNQEKWTEANKQQYKDKIKAWETDFSLFGTVEITNKIETYKTEMDLLAEKSVIRLRPKTETTAWADVTNKAAYDFNENIYYWYAKPWDSLTAVEQSLYGNLSANYTPYYNTYKTYYDNYCLAKAELTLLNTELSTLEEQLQTAQENMKQIAEAVQLENFNYNGDSFTEAEIQSIYRMYKDADYSNENFLITNITTPDEEFEILRGLLDDGIEKLSSYSRPQFDVDVDVDNLLALPDFQPFWSVFKNGNYMYVQYKDSVYMKLRMVSFSFNPCLPSAKDFKIAFSNQIRSNVGVSDLENLLGNDSGSSGRSSSGSGGGSGGEFGTIDGLDITISNTMLGKLLKTETFATRVSNIILDSIGVNALTAQSATFQSLLDGDHTVISGGCISTGSIKSNNYEVTLNGEVGSILNLSDGTFSFGSGNLKFENNQLTVQGDITANSGRIGRWSIEQDGKYLKGTSIDSTLVDHIVYLTQSRIGKTDSSYLDKYGFTVHNSYNTPCFYYWVRSANDTNRNFFMLLEEVENQNMIMNSGAVTFVRVFLGTYQGTYLIGQVIGSGHNSLPNGTLCVINTEAGTSYKGELEIVSDPTAISSFSNSLMPFDDDLGMYSGTNDGRYNQPIYDTARYNSQLDSIYVSGDTAKTNVLLSYSNENVHNGYTYLTSTSSTNVNTPIIAINTQVDSLTNNPQFDTSKIILYSNGTIKSNSLNTQSIQANDISCSNNIDAKRVIADRFQATIGKEFTITDDNYDNITLFKYVKNILITLGVIQP